MGRHFQGHRRILRTTHGELKLDSGYLFAGRHKDGGVGIPKQRESSMHKLGSVKEHALSREWQELLALGCWKRCRQGIRQRRKRAKARVLEQAKYLK